MIRILLDSAETAHKKMEERRNIILRSLEETYGYKEPEEPTASTTSASDPKDLEQLDDALRIRLETIGYKVGCCLAERYNMPLKLIRYECVADSHSRRLARDRPPIAKQQAQPSTSSPSGVNPQPPLEPLEVVKFVCKE